MSAIRLPPNHQITTWLVKTGTSVRKDETIAYIETLGGDEKDKLLALTAGFIDIISQPEDDIVAKIVACTHPAVLGKLCAVCGMTVENISSSSGGNDENGSSSTGEQSGRGVSTSQRALTVNGGVTLSISEQEAQRLGDQNRQRLHSAKKLSLVLDLDHTLVHATADQRASRFVETDDDVRTLILTTNVRHALGYRPHYTRHFVKLRPHIKDFFDAVNDLYEVSIYTAGTREYALKIADLICRHIVGARDEEYMLNLKYSVDTLERSIIERQKALLETDKSTKTITDLSEASSVPSDTKRDETCLDNAHNMQDKELEMSVNSEKDKMNDDGVIQNRDINQTNVATSNDVIGDNDIVDESVSEPQRKRVRFAEHLPSSLENDISLLNGMKKELETAIELGMKANKLSQAIFGSRIISRTDVGDLGRDVKDLSRVFPCGGTMSTILDDREDVWANAKSNLSVKRPGEPPLNLLLVRPYHWKSFAEEGFSDVNNVSGADLSEPGASESTGTDEDDFQLQWTADILKRLHKSYYCYHDNGITKSVPLILSEMRKSVFGDKPTNILLSGLLPIHVQNRLHDKNRPRPPYMRYCEDLGAKIVHDTTNTVTHVIAAREGTDKVKWGIKQQKCFVIKPAWLLKCYWSLKRLSEKPFRFIIDDTFNDDSQSQDSEESDDEFEAEMEKEFFG